jgi:hypothetical protein
MGEYMFDEPDLKKKFLENFQMVVSACEKVRELESDPVPIKEIS